MDLSSLGELIDRHARAGRSRIGESALISATTQVGPPAFSMTGVVFVLLAQGAKQLALGDRLHLYRPGQSLVASVELPTIGHFVEASSAAPALGFALELKPSLIAELLLQPGASTLEAPRAATPNAVSVADLTADLLDAVTRMVGLLDRPADLPILAPLLEREITWLVLRSPHGPSVRQLGLADSSLNRIARAVGWLRDRYAEQVRVDELAKMARMSPSAFHRGFQSVTAMSPIQFQKQLRLQEARVRLLSDHRDIAGVAYAVGYESPSQFSRDYKRLFGAAPQHDARTLSGRDAAAR